MELTNGNFLMQALENKEWISNGSELPVIGKQYFLWFYRDVLLDSSEGNIKAHIRILTFF